MQLPISIRVGAQDYNITLGERLASDHKIGEFSSRENKILLAANLPHSRLIQTLIHEIVECMNVEYVIGLKEHQMELLETALAQVFRDNPDIVEYLKE